MKFPALNDTTVYENHEEMPQYGSCFVPPEKCDVKSVRRSYQSDNSEDAWNFLASASLVDAVAPPPPAMLRLPWSSDRTRARRRTKSDAHLCIGETLRLGQGVTLGRRQNHVAFSALHNTICILDHICFSKALFTALSHF